MPKTTMNPYLNKARKIVRNLKALYQKDIAFELNITQQAVSYGIAKGFVPEIERTLRLLDLAGYEIKEKEEE